MNTKQKLQNSRLKISVLGFIAVVALAFLFVPTARVHAQACMTHSDCTTAGIPTCVGVGDVCPVFGNCPSGDPCAAGVCTRGVCQAVISSHDAVGSLGIDPPTGAGSLSDIVCKVIDFFSTTILPPIAVLMMLVVGFLFMIGGQIPQKAIVARKALLYVVAGVILLLLAPGIVGLVIDITGASSASFTTCASPITTASIVQTIANLINWFAWFVSITSVAMGLYAGALYLTSRGDSAQMLKATKVFSYTIIGIAVAVVSFSIIVLTRTFFGI